jgi:hypothetical protein
MKIPGIRCIKLVDSPEFQMMEKPPLGWMASKRLTNSAPNEFIEHHIKRMENGMVPMTRVVMENHLMFNFMVHLE